MDKIIKEIDNYYTSKIEKFGATPQGVDWNSNESQELRFEILSNLINKENIFSVLDFGCGFGSMYKYLKSKYQKMNYLGFDVSAKMIESALANNPDEKANFTNILPTEKFDFVIASGIFNVKLNNTNEDWLKYVLETLKTLDSLSTIGFSFNILTKYSDTEFMKDYLFYADPMFLFDFCKKHYSKNVALLHDYNLYEFTLIIRK